MRTVNAIYNNGKIKLTEKINISGKKNVFVTFIDESNKLDSHSPDIRKYWNIFSNMQKHSLKYIAEDKELEYE